MRDLTTLQILILYNTSRFSSIHYKEVKLYECRITIHVGQMNKKG